MTKYPHYLELLLYNRIYKTDKLASTLSCKCYQQEKLDEEYQTNKEKANEYSPKNRNRRIKTRRVG